MENSYRKWQELQEEEYNKNFTSTGVNLSPCENDDDSVTETEVKKDFEAERFYMTIEQLIEENKAGVEETLDLWNDPRDILEGLIQEYKLTIERLEEITAANKKVEKS